MPAMTRWIACVCLLSAVAVFAQTPSTKVAIHDEDDYSAVMKEIGAQSAALRKSLATPSEADAARSAARLEILFTAVQQYWETTRKAEDAVTAAKNGVTAAQAVAKSLAAKDMAGATSASQAIGATCAACHSAHRERLAYDFYRIK